MGRLSKFSPIARAVAIIGVTAGMVTGVTFAALSSTATLTDNSIASVSAGLQIYDAPSGVYATSGKGFTITDLIPGTPTTPQVFYLKNTSTANEKVTIAVPTAPSATGFTGWENLKVTFKNLNDGSTNSGTFQDLLNNDFNLPGTLPAGAQGNNTPGAENTAGNYRVSFEIDSNKVSGSQVTVSNFDIAFTATPVATPVTPTP